MNNRTKRIIALIAVVTCLIIILIVGACDSGREYYDDIHITLQDSSEEIIIKEWSYLLGSGAEVYYKKGGKLILLGETTGGDDGFCPFKEGLYEVIQNDNSVTVKWCFRTVGDWRSETFELP